MRVKKIEQPSAEAEAHLNDVLTDKTDVVCVPETKKRYNIKYLKWGTRRKITEIMMHKGKSDSLTEDLIFMHKIAACVILNGYWAIKFWYPVLWRWLAYIKQYSEAQLLPIVETGKKKIPVEAYLLITISAIGMKDTAMTMTRREAELFLQERSGAAHTHQEKKENG